VNDGELLDHGRRIAELERKVSELYTRLGQAEPLSGFASDGATRFASDAAPAPSPASEDPRVLELVRQKKKIQAIKLYRELTGVGLAEAKDAVEGLAKLHPST
jgi:ribosomal protein L7/L12